MDKRLFSSKAPGQLVAQTINNKPGFAFLPDPLPPKWDMPSELWPLISEAKEKVGLLEGMGRNLPNPEILLSPLTKTEAIKSSSIEGTYATPKELLMYELNPTRMGGETERTDDWRQVLNYNDSIHFGIASANEIKGIKSSLLKNMHMLLLRGVRGKDKNPGDWRPGQVIIGFPPRFVPPPRIHLEACVDDLIAYINKHDDTDWLIKSFLVHYQFETIHPFSDGNGRVGRLLLSLTILLWGPLTKPWLFMSSFFERNKEEYTDRLFNVSARAEWTEWVEFCLRGVIETANETVDRVDSLRTLHQKLHAKVHATGGSVRLLQLVDQLFVSPFIEAPQVAKLTGSSLPTARSDIKTLIDIGILGVLEGKKPVVYYAPEVFEASYS